MDTKCAHPSHTHTHTFEIMNEKPHCVNALAAVLACSLAVLYYIHFHALSALFPCLSGRSSLVLHHACTHQCRQTSADTLSHRIHVRWRAASPTEQQWKVDVRAAVGSELSRRHNNQPGKNMHIFKI